MLEKKKKVMVFGTFDGIHGGHLEFIKKAKEKGEEMLIVVSRDATVLKIKKRKPQKNEKERVKDLKKILKDRKIEVKLGNLEDKFKVILEYKPDLICLGYDQISFDLNLKRELSKRGLKNVEIERLASFQKWKLKSSKLKEEKSFWVRGKFRETFGKEGLIKEKDRILVAVSGGPDSMALLNLFLEIKEELSLKLGVAHVNYGLRGLDSEEDARRVKKEADFFQIPFELLNLKGKVKGGENEMRKARYAFFEKVRKEKGYKKIAIAHNAQDQVETIILRFLRGAGSKGLGGMKYRQGKIIRPILEIEKADLLAFLKENRIEYGIDRTNLEDKFFRNKVRNELLPLIIKKYNPNIEAHLRNMAVVFQDDYEFIHNQARLVLGLIGERKGKKYILDYNEWRKLPRALQRETLRVIYEKLVGDLEGLGLIHLEEVMGMLKNRVSEGEKVLLGKLRIIEKYDRIELVII
jgi:tRNA(Ile)-lysidine synthetase-like protein